MFSRSLFTQKASSILDVRLLSEYASGAVNYFRKGPILKFDWVLDTPLICLKKDKNSEKPVTSHF